LVASIMNRPGLENGPGAASLGRVAAISIVAWMPFLIFGAGFFLTLYEGIRPQELFIGAVVPYLLAIPLTVGVWWFTGWMEWPDGISVRFVFVHLLAGGAFSLLFLTGYTALESLIMGSNAFALVLANRLDLAWRFVMNVWLYGLVAGVCYVIKIRGELERRAQEAARAEALAARAQLSALRARLNPHFLFNALNALSSMVLENAQAEKAVERLGDLLRYSLDEGRADSVSLEEEWRFTQDYIALEQLRFDPPLVVTSELSPAALACDVPPFTLQPLVENAVRHGVFPEGGGRHIHVEARLERAMLVLEVADDGRGASPEEVETSAGTGLRDLRNRLGVLFGPPAGVRVDSEEGRGFRVAVSIPCHRDRNQETTP